MNPGQVNLLVFREDRRCASVSELRRALLSEMEGGHPERLQRALLRAGELECGVTDAAPELGTNWELLTDRLAEAVLSQEPFCINASSTLLGQALAPSCVEISKPEGFAYYALHPLAYAEVLDRLGRLPPSLAVIGIRSIGTILSAVTAAAARRRGVSANRTTVRPTGHPYNRHTEFSPQQLAWVQNSLRNGARFLVVDEGPGLSGSSFLSVAEALMDAGVPQEKITLICGHEPDLQSLCCDHGPQRVSRFRWVAVDHQARVPNGAEIFIGGGDWRSHSFAHESEWPASWTSLERLKYLLPADGRETQLLKFAGFGHYGDAMIQREQEAAAAGFAPVGACESEGFAVYPWLRGRPMQACDLSERVLARLAGYCVLRAQAYHAGWADVSPLQEMADHNLQELKLHASCHLEMVRPVIADGRMQPHEWLLAADGRMLKTDSGSHGDDHFFPGPTDIAWDLAGTIVEWRMNAGQAEFFLEAYRRASGDDARARINDFVAAYSLFRCAYCLMAANALQGSNEHSRLKRAAEDYRNVLVQLGAFEHRAANATGELV